MPEQENITVDLPSEGAPVAVEVERDIEKIMDRFDRLDNKMDNILERIGRG